MQHSINAEQLVTAFERSAATLRAIHSGLFAAERLTLDLAGEQDGEAADTQGFRAAEYEDAYGYKGKICTGGESLPPQSGPGGGLVPVVIKAASQFFNPRFESPSVAPR